MLRMTDSADHTPPLGRDITAAARPKLRRTKTQGPVKGRFGPQLTTAIEAMAHEGLPLSRAAQRAGMAVESLKKALRKQHVKNALNTLISDIRTSAGQAAYLRINHMGVAAESEHVRLEANKWVAGVDNIAPVKRVEGRFSHQHSFGGFSFGAYDEDEDPKDITPDHASDADDE